MKRYLLLFAALYMVTAGHAQKKNFSYKFYGQVRGDLFYNSRANAEIVDGLFHLYPKDKNLDADGNDLNATANGSFYLLYSRLGVDVTGPNIGKAVTTAKLEADFRGSGSNWAVLRIRHAYVNLDWGKSAVLVGQTWHPLFGDVSPQMLNLSTGAPFQPFNRSPQIRYRYTSGKGLQLTGAVLWQLQYLSAGPNGKSEEYIKNSCIPEVYVSADYKVDGLIAGAVVRVVQQYFLNKHFEKMNLEDIIKKNQEKAKKKREKMGIAENQISNAAKMNTRQMVDANKKQLSSAEKELEIEKANAAKSKAKAGSMSAKANMVREFNERNNRK